MTGNTHPEMDRFRVAAANFIQTVDSANACEREVFLAQLSHSLAELYSRALDLPGVGGYGQYWRGTILHTGMGGIM